MKKLLFILVSAFLFCSLQGCKTTPSDTDVGKDTPKTELNIDSLKTPGTVADTLVSNLFEMPQDISKTIPPILESNLIHSVALMSPTDNTYNLNNYNNTSRTYLLNYNIQYLKENIKMNSKLVGCPCRV